MALSKRLKIDVCTEYQPAIGLKEYTRNVATRLRRENDITTGGLRTTPTTWPVGAKQRVIICRVSHGGRYREVVTPYALELSWMFEQMRNTFAHLVDGCSKFELYGRLELAANAAILKQPDIGVSALCEGLVGEAEAILGDMASAAFSPLPLAFGPTIAQGFSVKRS